MTVTQEQIDARKRRVFTRSGTKQDRTVEFTSNVYGRKLKGVRIGKFLLVDNEFNQIYKETGNMGQILTRIEFKTFQDAVTMAKLVDVVFGHRLGWIGWENWLTELSQIHHDDDKAYAIIDAFAVIEKLTNKPVTFEQVKQVMKKVHNEQK